MRRLFYCAFEFRSSRVSRRLGRCKVAFADTIRELTESRHVRVFSAHLRVKALSSCRYLDVSTVRQIEIVASIYDRHDRPLLLMPAPTVHQRSVSIWSRDFAISV